MSDREPHQVFSAKRAYINGRISLEELERALEDRLEGTTYKGDIRIDGWLPGSPTGYDDGE